MQKQFLLLLILLPLLSFSQISINMTKATIEKEALVFQKSNPTYTFSSITNDSTFLIIENSSKKNKTERLYQFDQNGQCKLIAITFSVESNFKKEIASLLSIEKHGWIKINENQYISNFEDKLMIELSPEDEAFSIKIFRSDWTKLLYDILSGQ